MLKTLLEIEYFTFTIFFKRLLINEGFSGNLKLADITPIFKKDDKKKMIISKYV